MASQAAIFAETIAGMKKAVKRKAYDSDSDSSIEQHTNRGNKLLKKSRFVHEGQLAPPTGPLVYKRQIEHAGYMREIISQNAPLIDEEGYEVESDDDDEKVEEALATAAEMDPYSSIQIEQLLAPLTSAAELPTHPTLSKPFTSKTLTELTQQAGEMVQKENASLWKIKHLLTRLSGDSSWIPCGVVEAESDYGYFLEEQDRQQAGIQNKEVPSDEGDHGSTGTLISEEEQPAGLRPGDPDVEMHTAVDATEAIDERAADAILKEFLAPKVGTNGDSTSIVESVGEGGRFPTSNGTAIATEVPPGAPTNGVIVTDEKAMAADERSQNAENDTEMGAEDDADAPAPHRMRTRAQAQAVSDETPSGTRSATPEPNDQYLIHPYFVAPSMSRPDRDLGLPSNEAEETRRLLQLYIQKQEEVCRGAEKVYNGLLKASRYRKMVLEWTRAESHVGIYRDMADGEDWYDKEAWGLDEDLKKGQDEDDDEGATAGSTTKKTRSRRQ